MRFVQNLRYAWRFLLRNRGLNVIILLTLALGIGANTAIFTVDYATLFAPLSYPQPGQLVTVWSGANANRIDPSPQTFFEWRRLSRSFQELSAFTGRTFGIANIDQPESVFGMRVTANYFHTLGSPFFLGRDFLPGEDQEGKNQVVILTHKLWSHLGADPKFVGHTMRIDGKPYTVVGVLQPGIADRDIFELAMPLVFTPQELQNGSVYLVVIGRLKNGISIRQAQDDVAAITAHVTPSNPTDAQIKSASVRPLREFMFYMSSDSRQTLWWLLGGVGFVLLLAHREFVTRNGRWFTGNLPGLFDAPRSPGRNAAIHAPLGDRHAPQPPCSVVYFVDHYARRTVVWLCASVVCLADQSR